MSNNVFVSSEKQLEEEQGKKFSTEEATQQGIKKAKSMLTGKRDSVTDDILFGTNVLCVFQSNLSTRCWARFWMMLLFAILEEVVFKPNLDKKQKGK